MGQEQVDSRSSGEAALESVSSGINAQSSSQEDQIMMSI